MSETGSEGYEEVRPPEKDNTLGTEGQEPRGMRRLMRHVRRPSPEGDDPRDQPIATSLLAHISESGGKDKEFAQFDNLADLKEWQLQHPPFTPDQAFALKERLRSEISDDEIRTLATEQIPRLFDAVLHYQLPLKDYHTLFLLARVAAEKKGFESKHLEKKATNLDSDFSARLGSAYTLLTDDSVFDRERLELATEMINEVIATNGIARMVRPKGKIGILISEGAQYNIFGPNTAKLYADFRNRLKASLIYNPNIQGHEQLPELPLYMNTDQVFFAAQKMAHEVQAQDQTAQPLEADEQVMLPLIYEPWEVRALHEDKTATVKGIEIPEITDPVERRVPMKWLVRHDVFETYRQRLEPGI